MITKTRTSLGDHGVPHGLDSDDEILVTGALDLEIETALLDDDAEDHGDEALPIRTGCGEEPADVVAG